MKTVSALYVDPQGVYSNLPGVEPWGLRLEDPEKPWGKWVPREADLALC
jgi:hypothetical protein